MTLAIRLSLAAIAVVCLASASQSRPIVSGSKYMETVMQDCESKKTCTVKFTKIPAGKVLTLANVNCSINSLNPKTGNQTFLEADMDLAALTNANMALPIGYGGGTANAYHYFINTQAFAIIVGGTNIPPTITTSWSLNFDGDVECTIAGEIGPN
jgi:hypothetical protein